MRSLFISAIYFSFFAYGLRAPYVFLLGYIWVDIFNPQLVAYSILTSLPVSLLIAIPTLLSVLWVKKEGQQKIPAVSWLLVIFVVWMTLSLTWAAVPEAAFEKWDTAYKSLIVAAMMPLIVRNRTAFEAVIWIIVISGMAHCMPSAAKAIVSGGGGYGQTKGLIIGNSGWGEGSTLSMLAVCLIPLSVFLSRHSTIIPKGWLLQLVTLGFIVSSVLTATSTFARTGLVSLAVLGSILFFSSKRKLLYLILAAALGYGAFLLMGDAWVERMGTINDSSEGSAMGRVAVWYWTLEYVNAHPLGGSFGVYRLSEFALSLSDGTTLQVRGKAFHSVYFEVLGELGIPGLIWFGIIAVTTLLGLERAKRLGIRAGDVWRTDASVALRNTLIVFFVAGAFVGVAFQPFYYYLVALAGIVSGTILIESPQNEAAVSAGKAS